MTAHHELVRLTLAEAASLVKKREISPVELVEASLERIAEVDPQLKAFIQDLRVVADVLQGMGEGASLHP